MLILCFSFNRQPNFPFKKQVVKASSVPYKGSGRGRCPDSVFFTLTLYTYILLVSNPSVNPPTKIRALKRPVEACLACAAWPRGVSHSTRKVHPPTSDPAHARHVSTGSPERKLETVQKCS